MRISDWSSDVCSSDLLDLPFDSTQRPSQLFGKQPGSLQLLHQDGQPRRVAGMSRHHCQLDYLHDLLGSRSEERRVGEVSVRVDLGGRRIIKKKKRIKLIKTSNKYIYHTKTRHR